MAQRPKWWIGGILGASVIGGVLYGVWHQSPASSLSPQATQALAADGMTPVNRQLAPNFHLVNQSGQPVTLAQYRGKVVVLTFLDPVCWYECPLEALELSELDRILGPQLSARVQIVAVAANPLVHSVASIDQFDTEHGMNQLPNWTFATSPSTATLQQVWKAYYEYVSVPKYGMVDHAENIWIIGPHGHERWLSSPQESPQYTVGTAALLASYVAKALGVTLPSAANPTNLASTPTAPMSPQYPSTPLVEPLVDGGGWISGRLGSGYGTILTSADGTDWHAVAPEGISQRGGLDVVGLSPTTAWAMAKPYGYQADPTLFVTQNGGQSWAASVLPGPLPSYARQPLAAESAQTAWFISRHTLWETVDGGQTWLPLSTRVPSLTNAALSWSPGGQLWLSGTFRQKASLWQYQPKTGQFDAVSLSPAGSGSVALAPHWVSANSGLIAVIDHNKTLRGFQTHDGGHHWTLVTSPVTVTNPLSGGVANQGNRLTVLSPTHQLLQWNGATNQWQATGPSLPNAPVSGIDMTVAGPWVWSETAGGVTLWRNMHGQWSAVPLPIVP